MRTSDGARFAAALAATAALWGCGAKPAPAAHEPAPKSAESAAPTASASASPTATPSVAAYSEPPPIIIHEADLYGQIKARAGTTVTILSMLVTSSTPPAIGNKATLFRKAGENQWTPIADATIKTPLDAGGVIRITIVDEKKYVSGTAKKPSAVAVKTDIKLRWEW